MRLSKFKKDIARFGVPYKLIEERFDSDPMGCDTLGYLIEKNENSCGVILGLCSWVRTEEGNDWWDSVFTVLERYDGPKSDRVLYLKIIGQALGYDTRGISKGILPYNICKISRSQTKIGCCIFDNSMLNHCFNVLLDELGYELA